MPMETGMRGLLVYKTCTCRTNTQIIYCFLRPYQTVANVVPKMRIAPASK